MKRFMEIKEEMDPTFYDGTMISTMEYANNQLGYMYTYRNTKPSTREVEMVKAQLFTVSQSIFHGQIHLDEVKDATLSWAQLSDTISELQTRHSKDQASIERLHAEIMSSEAQVCALSEKTDDLNLKAQTLHDQVQHLARVDACLAEKAHAWIVLQEAHDGLLDDLRLSYMEVERVKEKMQQAMQKSDEMEMLLARKAEDLRRKLQRTN